MTKIIGAILTIVGLLSVVSGYLWNSLFPTPDANIGAGGLVVMGRPLAGVGLLLLVVSMVTTRAKSNRQRVG